MINLSMKKSKYCSCTSTILAKKFFLLEMAIQSNFIFTTLMQNYHHENSSFNLLVTSRKFIFKINPDMKFMFSNPYAKKLAKNCYLQGLEKIFKMRGYFQTYFSWELPIYDVLLEFLICFQMNFLNSTIKN